MSDFLDLQGAKDLNTDAIHISAVANSVDPVTGAAIDTHVNRVGGTDYTLQGFWNALGPVKMPWTSATGGTLTQPNQAFLHPANGNYYSWAGAFPHVVAPGTNPIAVAGYVPRTDVVFRAEITPSVTEALRRSYAEAGCNLADGSFEAGGTVTSATDVLLYKSNGKAYSYAGTLPHTVATGSSPSTEPGMWDDKSTEVLRLQSQREMGDPRGWGGIGDGVADDTLAVSAALQTGKLSLGGKTWKITSQITKTGKVTITGPGTIISPTIAIKVIDGSGSVVDNVTFMPDKVPYTIRRDHGTWAMVGTWEQRYDGYIPTPQDVDIWASVPNTVRNYNTGIGTGILFTVSSAAGGSNVKVSRISGSQVNIVIEGYTDSIVDKCSCGVGQLTLGGIFFHNGVVRAYNQALLGFRLPRGTGNKVTYCSVKYASLCGIVFGGNDKFVVSGNTSTDHAESAYKTLQYDNVEGISEDTAVMCTTGNYTGNFAGYCYYDGFDLQSIYGAGFIFVFGGHTINGNISEQNRLTGFNTNSAYNNISNNIAKVCGDTGINVIGTGNTVHGNKIMDCALAPSNPQAFQLAVQGDDCNSYGNSIKKKTAYSTYDYIHTGLLGAAPTSSHEGIDFGNYCEEGSARISVSDAIKAWGLV